MKEILKRTRWIWVVVYAFLTGMSVGRHDAIGVGMFALGGVLLFSLTTRWMNQLCEAAAKQGSSAGTITVRIEADTTEATEAIEALRNQAICAKRDIEAAFKKEPN